MGLKAQQMSAQLSTIPAPIKGVDARQAAGNMSLDNCLYTYNIMPNEFGMQVRNGFREWVTDVEVVPEEGGGIRTLIPYDGHDILSRDRLFACTQEGIWDVTMSGSVPVLEIAFQINDDGAGHGVHCHYTDDSGAEFLLYADESNGLYEYSQLTDTWIKAIGITGVDPEDIVFVMIHKQRLWMCERNTNVGWYLPVGSKQGVAEPFYFGSKFPHGGYLEAFFNWSVDGGAGLDDILVAVSSAGDVIPYQGSDPSTAETWDSIGTYFIGKIPVGRKFASEYGGNLYLLSTVGLIAMSDLTNGIDIIDETGQSLAYNIASVIRLRMQRTGGEWGWEMKFVPNTGEMVISSPAELGFPMIQFVLNAATHGWGYWRSVPIGTFCDWHGAVYFGASNNIVYNMDSYLDDTKLIPDPDLVSNGHPIEFSMLTAYTRLDAPAQYKQCQFIRPDFYSTTPPSFDTKALYDYTLEEITIPTTPPQKDAQGWDIGLWDDAVWGAPQFGHGYHELQSQAGIGRAVAIAMRGEAYSQAKLLSFDIFWTNARNGI